MCKNFTIKSFLLLLFIYSFVIPAISSDFNRLSGYFIDYTSSPLVIYGKTFPGAVIYQNDIMYAPLQDYLNMLGVSSSIHTLPGSFSINGQNAPLSLLATGPDRYTGKDIYYINVTAAVDYIKSNISYNIYKQGNSLRITIDKIATPVPTSAPPTPTIAATPVPKPGSIAGRVELPERFKYFTVKLIPLDHPEDSARQYSPSGYNGNFAFDNLKEGKYRIDAGCDYTEKGPLQKTQSGEKPFYFEVKTYMKSWSIVTNVLSGKETWVLIQSYESNNKNCYKTETIYVNSESEYYNYQVF